MVGLRKQHGGKLEGREEGSIFSTRGYRLTLSVEAFFDNSIA